MFHPENKSTRPQDTLLRRLEDHEPPCLPPCAVLEPSRLKLHIVALPYDPPFEASRPNIGYRHTA